MTFFKNGIRNHNSIKASKRTLRYLSALKTYLVQLSNSVNYSHVSKPFVISAVIMLLLGSSIGALWMMSLFGIDLPEGFAIFFHLHKIFQIDGFITLLIMGIGYMIIPRFRNIPLPSIKLAYLSFFMILASIGLSVVYRFIPTMDFLQTSSSILKLDGIFLFVIVILLTLRVKPKLLRLSDYFVGLSAITLIFASAIQFAGYDFNHSLASIELWLLFPLFMIFGIEYKTLPSFLGFIRPRRLSGFVSFCLSSASLVLGIASVIYVDNRLLQIFFNIVLLSSALYFGETVYAFGGYDNAELLRLIQGEKKARYKFTVRYVKLSFLFLYIGIAMAVLFGIFYETFAFYDLAIHIIGIGFIGTTIALYLPLMLPPVIGKVIRFTNFNSIPIILIIAALVIRAIGVFTLTLSSSTSAPIFKLLISHFIGLTGWFVLAAILIFVIMIYKSLKQLPPVLSD
ncbi:MAG TPA: hypothetical protein VFJ51_07755 [Nitrososphaeraceae archaeon]|nr:hypothetical protein [Nitrososphaeraceae archaeon]